MVTNTVTDPVTFTVQPAPAGTISRHQVSYGIKYR
jgi:hypothetical protein